MRPEKRTHAPVVESGRTCSRCGAEVRPINGCKNCSYRVGGGIWTDGVSLESASTKVVDTSTLPAAITGKGTYLDAGLTRGR